VGGRGLEAVEYRGECLTNRQLALGGAAVVAIGLFTPVVTLPVVGSVNLFNNGTNVVALLVLALAGIAAALAGRDRIADALWPGVAAAAVLLFAFLRLQYALSTMRAELAKSLEGNPFAGMAQAAMGAVQLQWGWLVLAGGCGLIIHAALKARREAGTPALAVGEGAARNVALLSGALLVAAIGWDLASRTGLNAGGGSGAASAPVAASPSTDLPSARAEGPSQEERAYIAQHLRLYGLKAKYYDSVLDGRVPGVDFKIKNEGNRTLNGVTVKVVFQDAEGRAIAEEEYNPVLVSEYSYGGDNTPLRPNYIWQNEPDKFYSAKSVPTEWKEGQATATITDIEFGPAE
jgi:hypothetical protein